MDRSLSVENTALIKCMCFPYLWHIDEHIVEHFFMVSENSKWGIGVYMTNQLLVGWLKENEGRSSNCFRINPTNFFKPKIKDNFQFLEQFTVWDSRLSSNRSDNDERTN